MKRRANLLGLAGVAISMTFCQGAVTKVREYDLPKPHDKTILFAMALTPSSNLLSWIASEDGKWRLARVRNWLDPKPQEDSIVVPGLEETSKREYFTPASITLLVSPDAKWLLCAVHALRSDTRKNDEFVSLVDLDSFTLVKTIHVPDVADLNGAFHDYHFDAKDRLLARTYYWSQEQIGSFQERKLSLLRISDLTVVDECRYQEQTQGSQYSLLRNTENCSRVIESAGLSSVADLDKAGREKQSQSMNLQQRLKRCNYFGSFATMSADGRTIEEDCGQARRGFWVRQVLTEMVTSFFDAQTNRLLGSVEQRLGRSHESAMTAINGHDYYLVMEGGTHLIVYEIAR